MCGLHNAPHAHALTHRLRQLNTTAADRMQG